MANERTMLIEEIYHRALEKKAGQQRSAYLYSACGEDSNLRSSIESLLKARDEIGDFLEVPPCDCDVVLEENPISEAPGTVIGRYKLLEKIGEGGMAVVYMAEQQEPIRRKVALKVIKLGMDTKSVIARFEAERQALAMMDHPNIARVLDAGATETGRPYFVMELVKGVSITEFCDKGKLSTQERLDLFRQVCSAVQHAHQKGIIHRDIKPSNVMVTSHDGMPVPKVIDFGIAKATNQRLTEKTFFTRYAQMIGTPAYMSPEQAELNDLDVDTRSDVYSLGVLLYELLTGTTPFSEEELRKAGYVAMQRIIREQEPIRPSTRLSTLQHTLPEVAAHRDTTPELLGKMLRGDLDWIVMKSLEKDRTRRYTTASEFTADIKRHLNNEPVLASPPSKFYLTRKLIQRHRVLVIASAVIAASIIIALVVSTSLYVRMRRALDTVSQLETKADVDNKLSTAHRLYSQGRYQAALDKIKVTLDVQDLGPKADLLQAQLLLELGQFQKAENKLLQLTHDPEIAGSAHSLIARINIAVNPDKAAKHTQLAESKFPKTAEAYYLRGMTAASADEAITWLTQALELDPRHYAARKARTLAYSSEKVYDKMTEDSSVLIVLRPHDFFGYAQRAIARRETGQFVEAVKDHNQAISLCIIENELPRLYDQRRITHMKTGDYRAALNDAKKYNNHFATFIALSALGEYEKAQAEYNHVAKQGTRPARFFKAGVEGYAFELLSTGQSLDLPADIALKSPYYYMTQTAEFYEHLNSKGRILPIIASWLGRWSPNSEQIVYSRFGTFSWLPETHDQGTSGVRPSFLEIIDLKTHKKRRISPFGMYPKWSPDGKHITFRGNNSEHPTSIWLVSSTGGTPRKLTEGIPLEWSQDSKHIYFLGSGGALFSIAIDVSDAEPEFIFGFQSKNHGYRAISPDGSLIAGYIDSEVRVLSIPDGREVARWATPWPLSRWATFYGWHSDGKSIILNSTSYYNQMGMCLFDVETKEMFHTFNITRPWCRIKCSPDRSQLIVDPYFSEPWLLEIDPDKPLKEVLTPAMSTDEFLTMLMKRWDERIKADPMDTELYVSRAVVRMSTKDFYEAQQDINQCIDLINEADDPAIHAIDHWAQSYLEGGRLTGAELWALALVQIIEKFPANAQKLNLQEHPYQQLIQIYDKKGEKQKQIEWQKKWQGI